MCLRKGLSISLRNAKKMSGLSSEDLVELTGLSKSSVNMALTGGEGVGINSFQKLFDACDYEIEISIFLKENDLF